MSKLLPSKDVKNVTLTLVKSVISCTERQKASVRGLGLRKTGSSVTVANTVENRGLMSAIIFLLKIEEAK